jgi:pyruvate/2-oxoglutarate dehydrogenase complex dihydrolipoamide dehydrogenase (E3) component
MAEHEAKIVVRNLLFPGTQTIPYDVVPWATFTDPELARVGLTEDEAREKHGRSVRVLRHAFRQDDRAITEGRTTGVVKVVTAGANGNVVGAQILGPQAGELIHEWVLAMRHKLPVRAVADLIHVYPTFSVSNQRAAQRWYAGILQKPAVRTTLSTLFNLEPRENPGL